jgi:2-polyprenyl-3-methyl-5-hydroxy-6-metoxy-1,4-benzoquinol methylase
MTGELFGGVSTKTLRYLARAIGRRCRGRTLILGRPFPPLLERLESQWIEAVARRLDDSGVAPGETFDTVVLVGAIEYEDQDTCLGILRRAHGLLGPRGKLLVCVPNADHVGDSEVCRRFTRAGLKDLLQQFDQPKLFTDQPLRWLVMGLDVGPAFDRPNDERYRVIAGLAHGSVLELGCGPGYLCKRIADRGLTVVGVDKNTAKIAKARRLFPDVSFVEADIRSLPIEEPYDTVILAEVIEHVPEEIGDRMLLTAWELVRPRGRLIVSVPNEDLVRHKNHVREFTQTDLTTTLGGFGSPEIVADQPFKWLLAYVDRARGTGGKQR